MAFAHQHAYICEAEMARGNAFSNNPPGQPQLFPRECEQQVTPPVVQQQDQAAAGGLLSEPLPGTDLVTQALDQRLQDLNSSNSSIDAGVGGSALSGTVGEGHATEHSVKKQRSASCGGRCQQASGISSHSRAGVP